MNTKQVIELMKGAGWTANDFLLSLNSKIAIERSFKRTEAELITAENAKAFMTNGNGIDNAQYDVLEKWVEARMGQDGVSSATFPKPQPVLTLNVNQPPVIVADESDIIESGFEPLTDITNHRARKKFLTA